MIAQPRYSHTLLCTACVIAYSFLFPLSAAANSGPSQMLVNANGQTIKVYSYRPNCKNPSILFVFHGVNRKAKRARDNAKSLSEAACMIIFAPLFDKKTFPNWRYHRAGVSRQNHIQPASQWTAHILRALLDFSRHHAGNSVAKIYLFGHSAGGQFLSRSIAYTPFPDIERIVIANPSIHVSPELDVSAPYGFGGLFDKDAALAHLKSYLSSPVTIYLGTKDVGNKYLAVNPMATRQGSNRYERGKRIFMSARDEARRRGIPFRWKLVEACGVGHSSSDMINANEIWHALGLSSENMDAQHLCPNNTARIHDTPNTKSIQVVRAAKSNTRTALPR